MPTGQKLLDSLAETWDFFFSDVLPTLQAIFYPVQVGDGRVHGNEGSPSCPRCAVGTWDGSRKEDCKPVLTQAVPYRPAEPGRHVEGLEWHLHGRENPAR